MTFVAPLVVQLSSICVGALHDTGEGGVLLKLEMRTVGAAPPDVGDVGTVVFVAPPGLVVALVDPGAVEDVVRDGFGVLDEVDANDVDGDVGVFVVVEDEEL